MNVQTSAHTYASHKILRAEATKIYGAINVGAKEVRKGERLCDNFQEFCEWDRGIALIQNLSFYNESNEVHVSLYFAKCQKLQLERLVETKFITLITVLSMH